MVKFNRHRDFLNNRKALLKMYDRPHSCAPIETWIPRGNRLKDDIVSRHAKIKRNFYGYGEM